MCFSSPLSPSPVLVSRFYAEEKEEKSITTRVKCHFPKKGRRIKKGRREKKQNWKINRKVFLSPLFCLQFFFSRGGISECGKAMCVGKYRSVGVAFQKRQAGVGRDRQTSIVLFVRLLKKEERIFPSAEWQLDYVATCVFASLCVFVWRKNLWENIALCVNPGRKRKQAAQH